MDRSLIRPVDPLEAGEICTIYNHYVEHTTITFEERAVSREEMAGRIRDIGASYPWLVYAEAGRIAGYAYATGWRSRSAYRFCAESTVYLSPQAVGKGIGSALYQALLEGLRVRGYHSVMAGIALPNAASVALHEKLGFRKVAHLREVGFKLGRWIDVGYWQTIFGSE